jgi:hypothetical protein
MIQFAHIQKIQDLANEYIKYSWGEDNIKIYIYIYIYIYNIKFFIN